MAGYRIVSLASLLFAAFLAPASAMPLAGPPTVGTASDIVKVQTMCDPRGCTTYGRVQSFRPSYLQPNYRPPTATSPYYYRPSAQGRAPLYYAPPPASTVRPATPDVKFHVDWCRNQYRSYNPKTDRFITYEGIYKTCNSPYD